MEFEKMVRNYVNEPNIIFFVAKYVIFKFFHTFRLIKNKV